MCVNFVIVEKSGRSYIGVEKSVMFLFLSVRDATALAEIIRFTWHLAQTYAAKLAAYILVCISLIAHVQGYTIVSENITAYRGKYDCAFLPVCVWLDTSRRNYQIRLKFGTNVYTPCEINCIVHCPNSAHILIHESTSIYYGLWWEIL